MTRHPRRLSVCLVPAVAVLCLLSTGCDPIESPPSRPARFKAPLPQPRRTDHPDPENAKWLAAWRDTRDRIAEMQSRLSELQKFHADYQLDHFLELDPESLSVEQLSQLFHFLDRGYFTVERRIALDLLERRVNRSAEPPPPAAPRTRRSFKERIAAAMQRDELRIVDIETALDVYSRPGEDEFRIPESLTPEEIAELRETVTGLLEETKEEVAEMDDRIARLKAKVFHLPEPEPRPEKPAPVKPAPADAVTAEPEPAAPESPAEPGPGGEPASDEPDSAAGSTTAPDAGEPAEPPLPESGEPPSDLMAPPDEPLNP